MGPPGKYPSPALFSSVQFSSVAQSCPTLCDPMNRSTPGLPVHHHLPEFTQTHVHRVGDAIQTSHPLSSPSPPASNPSQHQSLFQWVTRRMRWPKYWSFSFSIIPSKEHPGLISFRMDSIKLNRIFTFWCKVWYLETVKHHIFAKSCQKIGNLVA